MIQADICYLRVLTGGCFDIVNHGDGAITKPNTFYRSIILYILGDNAGRIGKIDQPRVRTDAGNSIGNLLHHRDGAQGFEKAADAGSLLTNQIVL